MMKKEYKNMLTNILMNHEIGINNFSVEDNDVIYTDWGNFNALTVSYLPRPVYRYHFINDIESYDVFSCLAVNFTPTLKYAWRNDGNPMFFDQTFVDFESWLEKDITTMIDDENEIDLWEEYQKRANASTITTIDYEDTTSFTVQEKQSVKLALTELKELMIKRFELDDIQTQSITTKLDYLTDRVEVLNKTDWKGILINTIISISVALSLDAQKGTELMNLVIQVFQFAPGLLNN